MERPEAGSAGDIKTLVATPGLAEELKSERFKQFLDHMPVAIAVADVSADTITYVNLEFERLTGQSAATIEGRTWSELDLARAEDDGRPFAEVILDEADHAGTFQLQRDGAPMLVDAWSNIIEDDDGVPMFRLVAMVGRRTPTTDTSDLADRIGATDLLLRELQHRVKNNLQMITALIRLEARSIPGNADSERFDRLAGRVDALGILYRTLGDNPPGTTIDLGSYLGQVASAVMTAHAVEGIRLELKVDAWQVPIDVAMPTGLVVNEALTNSLKHAFTGRDGGTVTLSSVVDSTGCRIVVADDGNGFDTGDQWPRKGKLGNLVIKSLEQNARARVTVTSKPGEGVRVEIFFRRADAEQAVAA